MFAKEIFGRRLYEARRARHETQEQLAALLQVTKTQVSEMEHGKKATTLEKLALICEHYGVSSDYLLGLKDHP